MDPFFTLIIPLSEKISYLFPFTLDSIVAQKKEVAFEVIIVTQSKESSMLAHLRLENVTIVETNESHLPLMVEKALKVAKGEYIHILQPGEFYIFSHALTFIAKMIHGHNFPDLIYTPRRMRHYFGQPTIDLNPLTIRHLKQGSMPASLQAFWFRRETMIMLGGLNKNYPIYSGYDLISRLFLAPTLRKVFVRRVLTDYEYRRAPSNWFWKGSLETLRISFKYFGPTPYLLYWIGQSYLRLFRYSWNTIRASFWKKHVTS